MHRSQIRREYFRQSIYPQGKSEDFTKKTLFVGFDTEYDPKTYQLYSFQLFDGRRGLFVDCRDKDKITRADLTRALKMLGYRIKDYSRIVFICNTAIADFKHVKWSTIKQTATTYMCTLRGNPPYYIVDIQTWIGRYSTKQLGEELGIPKGKWDRETIDPEDIDDPEFQAYALRDAEIVYEAWRKLWEFWKERGVNILRAIVPSGAGSLLLRREAWEAGYRGKLKQSRANVRRMALQTIWGGPVQSAIRGIKRGSFVAWDVKSCYPNAAMEVDLPLEQDWEFVRAESLEELAEYQDGFLKIGFKFPPTVRYPTIPVAYQKPDGTWTAVYPRQGVAYVTLEEARTARSLGAEVEILSHAWVYKRGTDIMRRLQAKLLQWRNEAPYTFIAKSVKMVANAVIGKLFQHVEVLDNGYVEEWATQRGMPLEMAATLMGVDFPRKIKTGGVFMPEWYALIVARARAHVLEAANRCNALYVNVDGLITERGQDPPQIGRMEFVQAGRGDTLIVVKPRLYALFQGDKCVYEGHWGFIGWRAWSAAQELWQALKEGVVTLAGEWVYISERDVKLKEAYRMGKRFGERLLRPHRVNLEWDNHRKLVGDEAQESRAAVPWETVGERYEHEQSRGRSPGPTSAPHPVGGRQTGVLSSG